MPRDSFEHHCHRRARLDIRMSITGLATDGGDGPSTTVDGLINSIPAASF